MISRREPRYEPAIKLTSAQIANPQPVRSRSHPESHLVLPRLNGLFRDHTFFVDSEGLNIVEPIDEPVSEKELKPQGS